MNIHKATSARLRYQRRAANIILSFMYKYRGLPVSPDTPIALPQPRSPSTPPPGPNILEKPFSFVVLFALPIRAWLGIFYLLLSSSPGFDRRWWRGYEGRGIAFWEMGRMRMGG